MVVERRSSVERGDQPVRASSRARPRLSRPGALSILLVLALLVSVVVVDPAAAAASGTSGSTSSTGSTGSTDPTTPPDDAAPVRSDKPDAPTDVRAVATPAGSELRWRAPAASDLAPAPSGYLILSCGPYAFGSQEATLAADSVCLGEESSRTIRVAAEVTDTVAACVPTATDFCVVAVLAETDSKQSRSVVVGSGGTAPDAPAAPVAVAGADGRSVELSWTPGADVAQVGNIPPIAQMWEVSRGAAVIARNLTEPRFIDDSCGLATRCDYSVRAVSPAGRSAAITVSAITKGTASPLIDQPTSLLAPGSGTISGSAGHGAADARPVELSLRVGDTEWALATVPASEIDGRWSSPVPASVPPGLHRIVARQSGLVTVSEPVAIAVDRPLSLGVVGEAEIGVATVSSSTIRLAGSAVASPPGSTVEIIDRWGYELPEDGSPTQEGMSLALALAGPSRTGSARQAVVSADGSWSFDLPVDRSSTSVHIITVTQTIPGVRTSTRHLAARVLAPAVLLSRSAGGAIAPSSLDDWVRAEQVGQQIPSPPSAPTSPTAVAGDASAIISWTAPASSAYPITRYVASVVGTPALSCIATSIPPAAPPTTCTISGLTNGTSYSVVVVARSTAGDSVASVASNSVVPVAEPPAAPTDVVGVSAPSSVVVSWSPVFSNGSPVTSYAVSVVGGSVPGCSVSAAGGGQQPSCTVTGLRNGTPYQFTVVARSAAGDSSPSVASAPVVPAAVPNAPGLVRATPRSGSATVVWASRSANGAPITSFTATAVEDPNASCTTVSLIALPAISCLVTGLTNGNDYTFVVVATNSAGISAASLPSSPVRPVSAPATPSGVAAIAGDATATVSWTTPASNGRPILSYSVRALQNPSKTCTYTVPASGEPANSCVISGLVNGFSYTFAVRATNALGASQWSQPSPSVIPAAVPGAPLSVTATISAVNAIVAWAGSASNGSRITSYVVTSVQDPTKTCSSIAVTGVPRRLCVVTGLAPGTRYSFTVEAISDIGRSIASAPSAEVMWVGAPGAPSSVSAVEQDGAAVVSWSASVANGSPVTSYVARSAADPTASCTVSAPFGDTLSCRISGLTNGVSQRFVVVANSAAGASPASLLSAAVTPSAVPSAPLTVTAIGGDGRATVSWSAAATNGAPITGYTVTSVEDPTRQCSTSSLLGVAPRTCVVSGLTNGTTHSFTVVATNRVGDSAPSSASVAVLVAGAPSAPSGVVATPAPSIATVRWAVPASNGSAIHTYIATTTSAPFRTCTLRVSGPPAVTESCVITGLVNGTEYSFTVRASNAFGTSVSSVASAPVMPASVPNAPLSIVGTSSGPSARLEWPEATNGGSPITSYVVSTLQRPFRTCTTTALIGAPPTSCEIEGLTPGTTNTFRVRAINLLGSSVWSVESAPVFIGSPPSTPTDVTAVRGNREIEVRWTASVAPDLPVTSYVVTTVGDPSRTCTVTAGVGAPATTSCLLTGLTNGLEYSFTVRAINAKGSSDASSPTAPTMPGLVPDTMAAPDVVTGPLRVTITWEPPADNGVPIESYEVVALGDPSITCTYEVPTSGDSLDECTITGLVADSSYRFIVRARNAIGVSLDSDPSTAVTVGTVDAPVAASATTGTNGRSFISWSAPTAAPEDPILSYTVTASPEVASPDTCVTTKMLWCRFTGLTNGVTYTFEIRAVTASGRGLPAQVVAQPRPEAPRAPASITAFRTGTSAAVRWGSAIDNGSPILSYTVSADQDPTRTCSYIVPTDGDPDARSCVVDGLDPSVSYTFSVVATNIVGDGARSVSSAAVEIPDAPTDLIVTRGDGTVTVEWSPVSGSGSSPTYRARATMDPSRNCVTTSTSCTISGLTVGVSQTFVVEAFNEVGTSDPSDPSAAITPALLPAAPSTPLVTAGSRTASVSWNSVWAPWADVTSYTATATSAGSPDALSCTTAGYSCTIEGLVPGVTYTITVAATSDIGTGASSTGVDLLGRGPTDAPTGVEVSESGSFLLGDHVDVTWSVPGAPGGGPFRWSEVHVVDAEGTSTQVCTTEIASTLSGSCRVPAFQLEPGVAVSFIVRTESGYGYSEFSAPTAAVTPLVAPAAPTGVSAELDDVVATITWDRVTGNGITGYTVTSPQDDTRTCSVTADADIAEPSCAIGGLGLGRSYTFVVRAINAVATGTASSPTLAVVPVRVPDAPTAVGDAVHGNRREIRWTAATSNGAAITSYVAVAVEDPDLSCESSSLVGPPVTHCTVDDVDPDLELSFTVTATNAAGTSSQSLASEDYVYTAAPDAPTDVTFSEGRVSWTAPEANGSPITSYVVTSTVAPGSPNTVPWWLPLRPGCTYEVPESGPALNTCTISSGITNSEYQWYGPFAFNFSVRAVNAVGTSAASVPTPAVTAELPRRVPSVTAKGLDGRITATWSPPANNATFPVDRYDVRLNNGTVLCSVVPTADATAPVSCNFAMANHTYTTIRVAAFNAFGQSTEQAWTSVTVVPSPSVVTNLRAVAGDSRATVSWTDRMEFPEWGTPAYTVSSVEDPTKGCVTEPYFPRVGNWNAQCVVTGLEPGRAYTFTVSAADLYGNSSTSPASDAVVPFGVPGAPTEVSARFGRQNASNHSGSMIVFWNPAPANGSAVTSYRVRSTTSPERSCTTTATTCEIAGLANGVEHSFIVTATNAAGAGADSEPSTAVLSAAVPSAPTGVGAAVVVSPSTPSITVSWDAADLLLDPVVAGNGSAITQYTVVALEDPELTCTTTSNGCTVDGVINGSTYTFVVIATNAVGDSEASSPSAAVTPAAVPAAPTDLTVAASDGRVTVGWVTPASNGSPILSYSVTDVDEPSLSCTYVVPVSGPALNTCTITGLVNGSSHSFVVAAVNAIGTGESSTASDPVTPTAAPGPVRDVTATPSAASVLVAWDAPLDDGGSAIDSVTVVAVQDPTRTCTVEFDSGTSADGSCVVAGLSNGTAYTFAVAAHNAVGPGPEIVSGEFTSDRTATVGSSPQSMSMDGTQLWIADPNANAVRSINPGSGALLRVTSIGDADNGDPLTPRGIVSDGTYLWVTNELGHNPSFDAERMSSITQYRVADGSYVRTIYVPWNPNGIASDGRNVWVTGSFHMRRTRIWNVAYPDAFQYQFLEYRVAQIDANTGDYIGSVRVGPPALRSDWSGQYWQYPRVDTRSTVASDGVSVWVANIWDDSVTQLDAITGAVIRTIAVGGSPSSISSDGSNVWVTNSTDATVSQIDARTGEVVRTIAVGNAPTGAISDGSFVWVANTNDDTVTQLAASTGSVLRTIPVGDAPSSIAVRGTEVWVGNAGSGDLTRIQLGVVPSDVPDAPTGVRATYGDTRATVTWDAAVPNGSAVRSYRVSTVEDPSRSCTVEMSTDTVRSCVVTGLVNGQSHTFTVSATNAVGESASSAASAPIVPAAVPGAPVDVTVTRGDREVLVSWTAGPDNGASIRSSLVTAVSDPSLSCVALPVAGEPDSCVVRGLTNATSYRFVVTATNSVGAGASSLASAAVVPAGVPDAPSGVTVLRGDGRVTVSWSRPGANGAPITSYVASVTGDPSASCTVDVTAESAESCVIEGLTNGDPITVDVVAINDVGSGLAFTSAPVTPAGVPGAPTSVRGTSSPGAVLVEWTAASANGSPVESYLVTTVGSPLRTCSVRVAISAGDGCTVGGLTDGVEYSFIVTAVNAVGVSADSLASEPVAPRSPPGAPTSVTAVAHDSGATISWTAPSANGSPITSYTAWPASDPDLTCSVDVSTDPSTSCSIDGLDNGTTHTFLVSATNAVGEGLPSTPSAPVLVAAAPDAPVSVFGLAADRRVTVHWTPASDNGSPVTEYRVVSVADPLIGCSYLVGDDTGDACTISGLINQTSYSFTVLAVNAFGDSVPSVASSPVAPDVVPGAPLSVGAVAGDGAATISWSAPVSNGSAIGSYAARLVGDASRTCVVMPGDPLSCVIDGLTNGVEVSFAVTAINDAGSSEDAVSSTVTPSGLPGAPVISDVLVPDGMLSARVSYTIPSANGSAITGFTAEVLGRPDLSCTNSGPTLGYGVCVVFGLEPGVEHRFVVSATNANGSTSSLASEPFLARSVPDAPGSVVAAPIMNGTRVSWSIPDGNGSPVIAIEVTATSGRSMRSCRYVVGVDSGDSCTILGLRNEVPHDVTVNAINVIGSSDNAITTVTPMGPPDAPEEVRAVPLDGSVRVSWRTPATNGAPITGYLVTVVGDDSRSCLIGVGISLFHYCTVAGLANGVEYRFSAVALSLLGEGAAAISGPARPVGPPSAPTDVVAVAGPGRAEVSWTAADDNGSPIDSYTVRVEGSLLRSCTYRPGISTGDSCVITGLTDGVAVRFVVIAHNDGGNGPASVPSAPVVPRGPPSAPTGLVANRAAGSVALSWSASDPRGAAVSSYEVRAVGDGSLLCQVDQSAGEVLSCVGPIEEDLNSFVVFAVNEIGRSAASAAAVAVVSAGVPASPTEVLATAGDASAEVTWSVPESNGSAIVGFTVSELTGSGPGCTVDGAASSSCIVSGLTNGVSYSFVVTASNAIGTSAPSSASAPVIPAGLPGIATSVVAVPSSHRLDVSWSAAGGNGAPVTSYVASVASDPSKRCSVVLPAELRCTITGVLDDVAQSVQVVASNRVGAGAPSMLSAAVTPSSAPDVPSIGLVEGGVRSATAFVLIDRAATGSPQTSVSVRSVEEPSLGCTEAFTSGASVWCEISGLEFGRAYTFVARASNAIGDSDWSSPSPAVTAVSTPAAPTDLSIDHSATTATVSWTPAADNGSPVLSHLVEASTSDGTVVATCATAAGDATPDTCTLVGLVAGSAHSVRVVAVNLLGRSEAALGTVTPESVPDAPGSVVASRGDSSATIGWNSPAANGRPIIGYSVVVEGDDSLTCDLDATSSAATSCVVTGLTNGTSYRFLVTARNALGVGPTARSAPVTPAAAPAAPTAVTGVKGRGQVTVSWTPGSDNGAPIESYTARVVGSPLRTCTARMTVSSSTSCTITGLTNGIAHTFEVVATNAVGTSPASVASAPVVPSSPFGTPDTPLDVSTVIGDGAITVRWTAPPANGNWISRYTVTSTTDPAIGCVYRTDTNWGDACTVSGLTNGTAYRFRVTATNAIGTSDPSVATPAAIPMPAPARVLGANAVAGDRSATVSWTPADGRGSSITSYVVTESVSDAIPSWMRPAPRTCTSTAPIGGTAATSCTVSGLTNGVAVRFSVRAVSTAGTGPASDLTVAVTPAGVPGAPALRTEVSGRSAYNVWNPPSSNGSAFTEVEVVAVEDPSLRCVRDLTVVFFSACTIEGLTYGTSYTFVSRFRNAVGFGEWSVPTAALTPVDAPAPVTAAVAAKGFKQLVVSWSAPAANGSPITSYTVTARSPGLYYPSWSTRPWESRCISVIAEGGSTSCVLTGLYNGSTYDVTIVATNAVGSSAPVVVRGAPGAVPASVTAVPVTADSSLAVSWTRPIDNGSAVTSYTATALGDVTRTCSYFVGAIPWAHETNRCVISGLTNGTTYAVTVVARNANGESTPAAPINAVPARTPDAPTAVSAVPGTGDASVSWTTPADDGGAAITSYTVLATRVGDINAYLDTRHSWIAPVASCTAVVPVPGPATNTCRVTGLSNGQGYRFSVIATNRAGGSAESALSAAVVPVVRPSAPALVVYPQANGSVTAITTINWDEGITSTTTSVVGQPSSSCTVVYGYCTISGLEYGREYRFSAVSTNAVGVGDATIAGPVTLEAPPVAPGSAVAIIGSTSVSVAFSNPPLGTDEVVASVVGDDSKSCTWSSRAGGSRLCTINGLTSPGSLTYQVVSRSYRLGRSAALVATNAIAPGALTVDGFTSSASPTASTSKSIAESPVLRGVAAMPSIPGTDADVILNWTPTGAPAWFTGTAGSVAHSVSVPVSADGTWSYTLPANFPAGTFTVAASQRTPYGVITNSASPALFTVEPSPVVLSEVFLRSSGSSSDVVLSGAVPANRTLTSLVASVRGGAQAPCTAVVTGSSWTCTLLGVPTTGSVQFDLAATSPVWSATVCTRYVWGCHWTYPTRPQTTTTTLTRTLAIAATSPAISSPSSATFGPAGAVISATEPLLSGFTLTGSASTDAAMQSSVVVRAHRGSAVASMPTATFTTSVSGLGAFSTPISLADGVWTLEVAQATTAGVSRAGAPITVLVDSAPPIISIGVPDAGGWIPGGFVGGTITRGWGGASVEDPSARAALTLEYFSGSAAVGTPVSTTDLVTCSTCTGQFSHASDLAAGAWTVRVSAASRTGVVASATRTFNVDPWSSAGFAPKVTLLDSDGVELTAAGQVLDTRSCGTGYPTTCDYQLPVAGTHFIGVRVGSVAGRHVGPLATGTVTLLDGDTVLGTKSLVDGSAEFETEILVQSRAHQLRATYSGSNWYASGESVTSPFRVKGARPRASIVPVYPNGIHNPGSLTVALTYTGQRGTTQYCNYPRVDIYSSYKRTTAGGMWIGGAWVPRPLIENFIQNQGRQRIASGQLLGGEPGTKPTGPGTIAASSAAAWGFTEELFTFWVASSGDDRCAPTNGTEYFDDRVGAHDVFTPVPVDVSMPSVAHAARVNVPTVIARDATVGTASAYSVGVPIPTRVDVCPATSMASNIRHDLADFQSACFFARSAGLPAASGVPVYRLDAAGNTVGDPVFTDGSGLATVAWTPTEAGWVTQRFQVGESAPTGIFRGVRNLSVTVPVEAGPVDMVWSQTPSRFDIGAAATSTITLGSANLVGTLTYRDHSPSLGALDRPDAAPNVAPAPWTTAPITCAVLCRASVAMPRSLRIGSTVLANWLLRDPTDTPTRINWWEPKYGGSTSRVLSIDHAFTSAATGLTYTLNSPINRAAPRPPTMSLALVPKAADAGAGLPAGQVPRDQMQTVHLTVANAYPDQWLSINDEWQAMGTVELTARPNCTGATYCSAAVTKSRFDLASANGNPTVVRSYGDSRIPTLRASMSYPSGHDATLTVDAEVFIGGMDFTITADYIPPSNPAVAGWFPVAASSTSMTLTGVGPAPISLLQGSATMSGGSCEPSIDSPASSGTCTASNISPMRPLAEAVDPKPGQTVYIQVQCDIELCTPGDMAIKYDLSESQPGLDPWFFTNPNDLHRFDPDHSHTAGGVWTTTATPTALRQSWTVPTCYYSSVCGWTGRGKGPFTCSMCAIYPIASLSDQDANATGGLQVGTSLMGLIAYDPTAAATLQSGSAEELAARTGRLVTFNITVAPLDTVTSTRVSRSGDVIRVMHAARWPGMAPLVQASPAAVTADVYMIDAAGNETQIAYCYLDGFCASRRLDGSALPAVDAQMVGGGVMLSISVPQAVSNGASIHVETAAGWGTTVDSGQLTLRSSSPARATTGDFAVSASGEWQGAVIGDPDISAPLFGWEFSAGVTSFFSSLFGESAAKVLTMITTELLTMAIEAAIMGPFMAQMAVARVAVKVGATIAQKAAAAAKAIRATLGITRTARVVNRGRVAGALIKGATRSAEFAYNRLIRSMVEKGITVPTHFFLDQLDVSGPRFFVTGEPEVQGTRAFFQRTPALQTANDEVAQVVAADSEQARMRTYLEGLNAARLVRASQVPEPTPCHGGVFYCGGANRVPLQDDIGFGFGQSTQFTQFFSTVVQTSVPGFDSFTTGQRNASTVAIDIMSQRSGVGGARVLGRLATCTFAEVCSSDDAVEVKTVNGSMVVAGSFPQWIAWTPPGAWLRVTVDVPGLGQRVTHVDIAFRGDSLPCDDYRLLTTAARGACLGVYDAMRYGAELEWSETYQWGYRASRNGALPWISSDVAEFDGRISYPNQYGLAGGLPFTDG